MSTSKHTPGPWRVKHERWVEATRGEHEGEILVGPTYWMEDAPEEAAANARLVAAAPSLLLALERIADMRDRDGNLIEMHRDELRGIARAALSALSSHQPD